MKTIIKVKVLNRSVSFEDASNVAKAIASVYSKTSMLVAWYDKKADRFFPQVACCDCGDGRPTWEIYADSRSATLKVDMNEGDFIFIFI